MTVQRAAPDPKPEPPPRERIVDAALRLMAERGLGGVSMTAVAESAGVARQTLYNHFSDVDSIVATAIEHHSVESLRQLRQLLATLDDPPAKLVQLVRHRAALAAQGHSGVTGFLDALSFNLQEQLRSVDDAGRRLVAGILREGVRSGDFRPDVAPERDAYLLRRMLDGVDELAAAEPGALPEIVDIGSRTILAAVSSQRSPASP